MADQVNPTGSLISGLPLAGLTTPAPRATPETAPSISKNDLPSELTTASVPAGGPASSETALAQINSHLQQAASDLKIQVDKSTGRTVFKVVDSQSGNVILQVPSEEVLAMARNLRALDGQMGTSGVLVDKKG